MTWRVFTCAVALVLAACGGCGDDNNESDTGQTEPDLGADVGADAGRDLGSDAGTSEVLGSRVPVAAQEGVSADGAFSDVAIAGEARAGRIAGSETGFHGLWSHCKVGDFRLINEHVDACISNEVPSRYESFAGGLLLDVRPTGSILPDVFDLYVGKIGFNMIYGEKVEVVRDGTDGGAAVVRVTGSDMPAAYFVGVAGDSLFTPMNLTTVTEYRLGPDADAIEILTFVTNNTDVPVMAQKGDLIAWGDRTAEYFERTGTGLNNTEFQWMAAHAPGQAFAWVTPDDGLKSLTSAFGDAPWQVLSADAFLLQPEDAYSHFGYFVVGDELDAVSRRAKELLGLATEPVRTLTVLDSGGDPVAGRWVEVFNSTDESLAGGVTDANGQVRLGLADGSVRLAVSGLSSGGGDFAGDLSVADTMDAEVAQPGRLKFDVQSDGVPVPAAISVSDGTHTMDGAVWGDRDQVELLPGEWNVTVSRGIEYDAFQTTVTVTAGETVDVPVELTHIMDTGDWLAADFHQHMEPSSDSRVWVEDRVLDNASQGMEVLIPTDHDVVTDLVPLLEAASLTSMMTTFPGAELSPALAHTNVYPLPWVKDAPGRGAIPLAILEDGRPRRRTVPELIAEARQVSTDPVVQINHPRDSSGLFDFVGFDPELGPDAVDSRWFTTDFDAMELVNGDDCQQFKDLSGFWNAGVDPTPIGSSDSHGLWGQVGTQHTYLYAPGVAPADLTAEMLRDIVKAGKVSVASSIFVDFTDGTIPGDTLDGSSGAIELGVRVQSADWVGVTEIHVIVNGTRTQVIDVTPTDATTDYIGTITVPVTTDSWVVIMATGAATGTYVPTRTLPLGVTSPLRIDFDSNGYTPPGVGLLDLDDTPVCR